MDHQLPTMNNDRPRLPYTPGFSIPIKEQRPPGYCSETSWIAPKSRPVNEDCLRHTSSVSQVISRRPEEVKWNWSPPHYKLPGENLLCQTNKFGPAPPEDKSLYTPREASITITQIISVGEDRGPQLVVCDFKHRGRREKFQVLAKIYDALYYPRYNDKPIDIVYEADYRFSFDAHTYEQLEKRRQEQPPGFGPHYYGSWTCNMTLVWEGRGRKRPVRLVLMEYLDQMHAQYYLTQNPQIVGALPESEPQSHDSSETSKLL
ncbi:hypothetical protein F4808DRAFT_460080 [Astrocystis sublimbata]|nr:hypothetical protein F4808DRAFT_460080 [Astrocystis sublimbata]